MTEFTELDFDRFSPSFFFIDRKAGLKIALGVAGMVETHQAPIAERHGNALLTMQSSGMDQDRLDGLCRDLEADCREEGIEILVTKSRHHFDRRWYILGDLRAMLTAAKMDKPRLPFGRFIIDDIDNALSRLGEQP